MMKLIQLKEYLPKTLFRLLEKQNLDELRPCQKKAIRAGLLEGKNLIVCTPTGSGKTLVAEIACIKTILERKGKCAYIVPLKSLALEKYKEFKAKYPMVKIGISIGDLDSSDPWLANYDLIITTSEKLDSLIRHGASWITQISVVVIDEIHLLNDAERGPTLEILITLLRKIIQNAQIIALSATIGNTKELADWLEANPVEDGWRPIQLHEGILYSNEIDFFGDKNSIEVPEKVSDPTLKLAINTIKLNKQALIFCPSKQSAEATAEKIGKLLKKQNPGLSKKVLSVLPRPTRQCRRLAACIERGSAFHHAGLMSKQKELIENNFRNGAIKTICCTPTLAAGVNLPAFRAIMRSLKRFSKNWGAAWIPVLEYKQMTGRAGRPGMEKFGEALSIAKSEDEKQEIYEKYICGEPEPIISKLAVEPVLRAAILSLIASGFTRTANSLIEFFESSFYGHQYERSQSEWNSDGPSRIENSARVFELENKIMNILAKLKHYKFIETKGERTQFERSSNGPHRSGASVRVYATLLGKRISELYIDPESGHVIIEGLKNALRKPTTEFSFLQLIASTIEVPSLRSRGADWEWLQEKLVEFEDNLLVDIPKEWDIDYQSFLDSFKTALMLQDWISERPEDYVLEQYKVRPGELYNRLTNSDWMLYASQEIAKILGYKDILSNLNKIRIRVKYGIREELMALVKLKDIGRFRARKLYANGFKNLKRIKAANTQELAKLIGSKTAANIKQQLTK